MDKWIAQGKVTAVDVIELIHMLAHDPVVAIWLMDYINPEDKLARERDEAEAKRKKQVEQWNITALRMLNQVRPKDDADAERIAALKENLAHGD